MQNKSSFRKLRLSLSVGLLLGAFLFILPLFAISGKKGEPPVLPPTPSLPVSAAPTSAPVRADEGQTLRVLTEGGRVEEMTLADYLWRVVAAEMPAGFEPEALKAQAVCARTYTLWKLAAGSHGETADICADSSCCQAYTDPARAAEKWGEQHGEFSAKIARAVENTDGMVLTYGGEPIQAVFFSSSTYTTEDAAAVWGSSLPYLVSVESPEGDEVPNYRSTVTLTAEQMRALAASAGATLSGKATGWISGVSYTASGRVASLKFGDVTLSGGGARTLFGLRSACFTVREADGVFTFSVTGYGHGVGMSQYGANAMAAAGSTWQDIVTHYYTGIDIESVTST